MAKPRSKPTRDEARILSESAAIAARLKWSKKTPEERSRIMGDVSKVQWQGVSAAKRSERMRKVRQAAGPVAPEVAKARAKKAWETRRKNLEAKASEPKPKTKKRTKRKAS